MADETRTTQYLFEFVAGGVKETSNQFKTLIDNLAQYETQIKERMASIEAALAGKTGGAATTIAAPVVDTQSIQQAQAAIQQAEQLSARLGTAMLPATAGVTGNIKSIYTETRDGVERVKEVVTELDGTVVKSKQSWDAHHKSLGTMETTIRTLPGGIKETTVSIEGLSQAMKGGATFSEQFVRHLKWIGQGIVLWGAINAVSNAMSDWLRVQRELNQSMAEFEMRTGATAAQTDEFRESILAASQRTGVSPVALAQVAPVAPDSATLRYAAELQRVAGGDLQNQMQWLIASQRQFGMEGENTVQILNAMASGWRLTTLPMSQYLTMLQNAAPLSHDFNLSMEETYSLMGALQSVTGLEGKSMELLLRNMTRLYEPDVQQKLGVQTTRVLPGGEIEHRNLVAVLDEVNEKIKTGEISLTEFAALFGAVGRGQRQQAQQMMMSWDTVIGGMENSMNTPTQWSTMFGIAMDQTSAKTDGLKSAWERLLASIADTESFNAAVTTITGGIELIDAVITGKIGKWAELWKFDIDLSDLISKLELTFSGLPALFARLGREGGEALGREINVALPPWVQKLNAQLESIPFIQWLMRLRGGETKEFSPLGGTAITERTTAGMQPTYAQRAAAGGWPVPATQATTTGPYKPGGEFEGTRELPAWPSQVNIPKGVDFSQVTQAMNQWVAAFSSLGPEFENWINANLQQVMVYDENTHHLQMMNVFLPALQRAITENTQALKQELQPGLRTTDLDLAAQGGQLMQWVQYYTQFLNQMGYPQESQPQLILGENDTFLRLWSSNEALMLALRALTEATEDQTDVLSGMWNVPEGATMWVPIQSLFYSRKQEEKGIPPGLLGGPPALPAAQPDWMKLPGAVDNMSVGNITVTSLSALAVDMPEGTMQPAPVAPEKPYLPLITKDTTVTEPIGAMVAAMLGAAAGEIQSQVSSAIGAAAGAAAGQQAFPIGAAAGAAAGQSAIDTLQIGNVTVPTMEIQTPDTNVISPTSRQTSASTSIVSPAVDMMIATANLTTTSLTGFNSAGMESLLQDMAATLVLILGSLQSGAATGGTAPYTPPVDPGEDGARVGGGGRPTPNDIRRFQQEANWWDFTNQSRMKSAF